MGTIANFNPVEVHSYPKFDLGGTYEKRGRQYKYVEFAADAAQGVVTEFVAGSGYTSVTGAGGIGSAGVVTSSGVDVSEGFKYGWVQFKGPNLVAVAAATATEVAGNLMTNGAGAATSTTPTFGSEFIGVADAAAATSLFAIGDVMLMVGA